MVRKRTAQEPQPAQDIKSPPMGPPQPLVDNAQQGGVPFADCAQQGGAPCIDEVLATDESALVRETQSNTSLRGRLGLPVLDPAVRQSLPYAPLRRELLARYQRLCQRRPDIAAAVGISAEALGELLRRDDLYIRLGTATRHTLRCAVGGALLLDHATAAANAQVLMVVDQVRRDPRVQPGDKEAIAEAFRCALRIRDAAAAAQQPLKRRLVPPTLTPDERTARRVRVRQRPLQTVRGNRPVLGRTGAAKTGRRADVP